MKLFFYNVLVFFIALMSSMIIGLMIDYVFKYIKLNFIIACGLVVCVIYFIPLNFARINFNIICLYLLPVSLILQIVKTIMVFNYRKDKYVVTQNDYVFAMIYATAIMIVYMQNLFNIQDIITWDVLNVKKHPIAFNINLGFLLFGAFFFNIDLISFMTKCYRIINKFTYINKYGLWTQLQIAEIDDNEDTVLGKRDLLDTVIERMIKKEMIVEASLAGYTFYFHPVFYSSVCEKAEQIVKSVKKINIEKAVLKLRDSFDLPEEALDDFFTMYIENVTEIEFEDEQNYLVHSDNKYLYTICSCCGIGKEGKTELSQWFCSSICEDTEQKCIDIVKNKNVIKNIPDATSGFIVASGAQNWKENYQITSVSNQKHGFAAEKANTKIDTLLAKDAKVVGGDNAKDGADRLVNGQLIQTKYCNTAQNSVSDAFTPNSSSNPHGEYRYIERSTGKLMQLEVPKDQYSEAVKAMESKIREGKVPGIKDPAKAKTIIRKGHLTYAQAMNISKFGTIESLVFDASTGVVVGLSAGGIDFIFTTAIVFWKTGDLKQSVRSGLAGAAKTATKGFTVFLISAQLQKIPAVTTFVEQAIRIKFNPQDAKALVQGIGRETNTLSTAAAQVKANRLVRGAVVTAIVTFTVTSTIELVKMSRGRISEAQFLKNIVVSASGIAGGTAGAIWGAAAFAPVPFIGPLIGSFLGGIIGGAVSSSVVKGAMDSLIEDDSIKMMKVITKQIEYLAIEFVLSSDEMTDLSDRLDNLITQSMVEDMFESKKFKAYANFIIKPIVVDIISDRPTVGYLTDSIIEDAIYEIVAS